MGQGTQGTVWNWTRAAGELAVVYQGEGRAGIQAGAGREGSLFSAENAESSLLELLRQQGSIGQQVARRVFGDSRRGRSGLH